ncbi:MAG TPA: NHL repeat-containing protein [bacterium]|jgi:tripartite motif-containing protein 71|nr:NHL repeat-containing protein [bacterium]
MKRLPLAAILFALPILGLLNAGCPAKSSNPTSPAPTPTTVPSYTMSVSFGSSGVTAMNGPAGIGLAGADIWVANETGGTFQEWTTAGVALSQASTYNGSATFVEPWTAAIGADGYIYVADEGNLQVEEFTPAGTYVTAFASAQLGTSNPRGVAVNSTYAYVVGEIVYGSYMLRYTLSGPVTGSGKTFTSPVTFGNSGTGALGTAINVCLDASGNVYVCDYSNNRVVKYDPSGVYQMAVTQSLSEPRGAVVDANGNIFVSDSGTGISPVPSIHLYDPSGNLLSTLGAGTLSGCTGLALDTLGNLYAADSGHNRVVWFKKN